MNFFRPEKLTLSLRSNIERITAELSPYGCKLIAVSKTHPFSVIRETYEAGHKIFGENKVQELTEKKVVLPEDIEWHMIGHLQRNKVKYIAPFVSLIHSVDSMKLLQEIHKEGLKNNRIISCLLQIHIAEEETKFGFSEEEAMETIHSSGMESLTNIKICGLMGMATNTENMEKVRKEFRRIGTFFNKLKKEASGKNVEIKELSIGMSSDYKIALEEGSTIVRIGSAIFGSR